VFDKKKKGEKGDLHKADMEEMHPAMKQAKLGVLKHLSDMAGDAMGSKLAGLKKVTVASDSDEGLKHGIEKAKDIVEKGHIPGSSDMIDGGDEEGSDAEEASESPEEEAHEQESGEEGGDEDLSPEDIEKKIAELQALLHSKKA
jgi:hypothetical protein